MIVQCGFSTHSSRHFLAHMCTIRSLVGLGGVYDISDHYEHEALRGLEFVSPMTRAMFGEGFFAQHSPTSLLQQMSQRRLGP